MFESCVVRWCALGVIGSGVALGLAPAPAAAQAAADGPRIHVGPPSRVATGVRIVETGDGIGIRVGSVERASPADRAGLKPGDRIVTANGCRLPASASLDDALAALGARGTLELGVQRPGASASAPAWLRLQLVTPAAGASAPPPGAPAAPCKP